MTKVSYEIYDVRTGQVALRFTDYDRMRQSLAEIKETWKEKGEFCPAAYRQVYTPIVQKDEDAKSYIQFYKDKFARA